MLTLPAPVVVGREREHAGHEPRDVVREPRAEEGSMTERLNDASEMYKENQAVMEIVEFIRDDSSRAICQPRTEHGGT